MLLHQILFCNTLTTDFVHILASIYIRKYIQNFYDNGRLQQEKLPKCTLESVEKTCIELYIINKIPV